MKPKEFDEQAKKLFATVLVDQGFSCENSKQCTFYREVPGELFHMVMPDPGTRGVWFDVKVFATSPRIDPLFRKRFPDHLGVPSDVFAHLNRHSGVGRQQQSFKCETSAQLLKSFEEEVAPLLQQKGLRYLNAIKTLRDLVPLIKHQSFVAPALYEVGDTATARPVLESEVARLKDVLVRVEPGNPDLETLIAHFEHLLARTH